MQSLARQGADSLEICVPVGFTAATKVEQSGLNIHKTATLGSTLLFTTVEYHRLVTQCHNPLNHRIFQNCTKKTPLLLVNKILLIKQWIHTLLTVTPLLFHTGLKKKRQGKTCKIRFLLMFVSFNFCSTLAFVHFSTMEPNIIC